jgi:DNA repair and recombination RAD54-like protein
VFCGLSDFQLSLYKLFISSPEIQALLRGVDSQPLKAINILKKLCNHPELLDLPNDLYGSEHLIPEGFCGPGQTAGARGRDRNHSQTVHCEWSGKFIVLERCVFELVSSESQALKTIERFLHRIHSETNDKIVLISNYTQTLDIFEKLLRSKK